MLIRMIWTSHVAHMGDRRGACRVLVGRPDGKRPFGRPGRGWENIKMDLLRSETWDINWIDVAQDRGRWRALVNEGLNLRGPIKCGKFFD
jgi:hypothetical protein